MEKHFKNEIQNSLKALIKGKTILYPTDTIWGIGCDASDKKAVNKVFKIKKRKASKSLVVLVDSVEMLQTIILDIPKKTLDIISKFEEPTSIIYNNPKGLAPNVIAKDNSVAIRIVQDLFCQKLIYSLGKPIVSTSANISGESTPLQFSDIPIDIIQSIDYSVKIGRDKLRNKSSRILRIVGKGIEIIRD